MPERASKPILHIQLFVSSEHQESDEVAAALLSWAGGRSDVRIEMVPVLSRPEAVVRLGIFYAPALVVDGQLVAGGIESAADLANFLPD